jgi:hypothetical protein
MPGLAIPVTVIVLAWTEGGLFREAGFHFHNQKMRSRQPLGALLYTFEPDYDFQPEHALLPKAR